MRGRPGNLLPYCIVAGSMSLGYGSIYTLLADLRDRYGFSEAQLGVIVAAGFLAGFAAQLSLARLADRGYAPLLVRGGVVLAMGAMVGSALATEFWAFLLRPPAARPRERRGRVPRCGASSSPATPRPSAPTSGGSRRSTSPGSCSARSSPRSSPRLFGIRAPFVFLAAVFVGVLVLAIAPRPHRGNSHRRRPWARAAGPARAPRDPGDARGLRRVLRDRRHVRGDLGGAAARPRRGDVAHRPHAVDVHAADDLLRTHRRSAGAGARARCGSWR